MRKSSSNLSTHFGAIVGTYCLGPLVVESVLMPLHDEYVKLLEMKMEEYAAFFFLFRRNMHTHTHSTNRYSKNKSPPKRVSGTSACIRCRYALNRAVGILLRYKISHYSRFSKSVDLKSRLNGLREGTSTLNEERMLPFLQQSTDSSGSLFSTPLGEILL